MSDTELQNITLSEIIRPSNFCVYVSLNSEEYFLLTKDYSLEHANQFYNNYKITIN